MICKKAYYNNFRNIEEQTITFSPGINMICGDNAQGKTSALEGIYLLAQGRSHRSSKERDFIRFGQEYSQIGIEYSSERRRDNTLAIKYFAQGRKYCRKNGVPIGRMSEFIGNFRAIIFTPEHLSIVKEGPANRRLFLDSALSQLDQGYLSDLQNYHKSLIQRNRLLQSAETDMETFRETVDLWSGSLAALGERISAARDDYISKLSAILCDIYRDMTGGREKITLRYRERRSGDDYRRLLSENLDKELKNRVTLYGVHKDDIDIEINDRNIRDFGSQGQQRSAALAMKLAEGEISNDMTGEYPVFLLDDILSELDRSRRDYIMKGIAGKQVIITACEGEGPAKEYGARMIKCKGGEFFG